MFLLFLTIFAILIQGLFASFEMAALSLNRFRLQFLAQKGNKNALWLLQFLEKPSRFFGCILVGINAALQIGAECSRGVYEYLGLDPDLAPITQVLLVVIFAELSPMFAARRHPTHIALALTPFMRLMNFCLYPFSFLFSRLSNLVTNLIGQKKEGSLMVSREEIALALREQRGSEDLDVLMERIFQCKNQTIEKIMTPIANIVSFPLHATKRQVRETLKEKFSPFIGLYRGHSKQIGWIVAVRDLLRIADDEEVFSKASSAWFVPDTTSLLETLHQFKCNHKYVCVAVDFIGKPSGIVILEQIILHLFGEPGPALISSQATGYIERTLQASMKIEAFNQQFLANISKDDCVTIEDLILAELGHLPVKDEIVEVGMFSFTVLQPTLRGVGLVSVRSLVE